MSSVPDAAAFRRAAALPPAAPATLRARWAALEDLGRGDLSAAKLLESHADAVQILREAGRSSAEGCRYAVWASRSGGTGLSLGDGPAGIRVVRGIQRFASGATVVDRALVTATDEAGVAQLVELDVRDPRVRADVGSWVAVGMAGTATADLTVDDVPVEAVGEQGWYGTRPGFWLGGIGVAAVWLGATKALLARLATAAASDGATDAVHVHHAAAAARVLACDGLLDLAAGRAAANWTADHRPLALAVRQVVERSAVEVVDRCGRALGAPVLVFDAEHARRVADLQVFVRQHNADRDLVRLSEDLLR